MNENTTQTMNDADRAMVIEQHLEEALGLITDARKQLDDAVNVARKEMFGAGRIIDIRGAVNTAIHALVETRMEWDRIRIYRETMNKESQ